jgi:large conductance mechanosensitive channel
MIEIHLKSVLKAKRENKFDQRQVIEPRLPKCMAEDAPVKKSFIQEFMDFLQKFSVIGLAIAFVIGQAASKLISAFVNDLITPFIGLLTPNVGDLNKVGFTIGNSTFSYGDLISNMINFLIIALVIFLAYKQLSKIGLMKDPVKG